MRILIALGGNALLPRGEIPDASAQVQRIAEVAPALAAVAGEHELVLTHGNGPQVGLLAVESSDDPSLIRPYFLDAFVAETQGMIGYWLQQAIGNASPDVRIATLITRTLVSGDDPAFADPTKFVGATMTEDVARLTETTRGWTVRRDGASWRRVVPSPAPIRIIETAEVAALGRLGVTVVCAGGGGCPVAETDGALLGVEAVVDKDSVAALLALELGAHMMVLLTDVPAVVAGYGTPESRPLGTVTVDEISRHHFAEGSMGPKVAAACRFAQESGRVAVIGALEDVADIVTGTAGTRVTP